MDYIINQRQVILNFSERFCKNEIEVLNSACFKDVWGKFLDHIYKVEKQDVLRIIEILPNPKKDYIILFKLLLEFELNEISMLSAAAVIKSVFEVGLLIEFVPLSFLVLRCFVPA